jgi:hypothetical protein
MRLSALLHLAWADVLERVRRSSFLLTLGATLWLGYLAYNGNIQMGLGHARGVVNSAWIGTLMALSAGLFVSLAGFYVVKNTVERDCRTGVGQILAATRMSSPLYLLAKWLSNLAVLATILVVLAAAALALNLVQAEDPRIDLWALLAPFLLLALPTMALIAAFAVVFETVPLLAGGFGNGFYFFFWTLALSLPLIVGLPWADSVGLGLVETSLAAAVQSHAPQAGGEFFFNAGTKEGLAELTAVPWNGVSWDLDRILLRLAWFAVAAALVAVAAVWFDRFDTTRERRRSSGPAPLPSRDQTTEAAVEQRVGSLSRLFLLAESTARGRFGSMVLAELRVALKGTSRWWGATALALVVASAVVPGQASGMLHAVAWIWPLLLWSKMGERESRLGTEQLLFSCPHPLRFQFLASWTAGGIVTALTGSGFALRHIVAGDPRVLGGWAAGVLFIPSLALALGAWTRSSRPFEALFTAWWYVGPMHSIPALDFTGASRPAGAGGVSLAYLLAAVVLLALGALGRARRLRGD